MQIGPNNMIKLIPPTTTKVAVTYEVDGKFFNLEGHPADIYVQLDALLTVLGESRFSLTWLTALN